MFTVKNFNSKYTTLTYTLDQSQSDPSKMITAVSDAAKSMTTTQVLDWIWAYPVLLDSSWWEYRKLNPSNFQQFADWSSATNYTASTSYDVMIKFPRKWYKLETSWTTTTFSLTDNPNADGYCYAPFQRLSSGTLWESNAVYIDASAFYLWAYKWYVDSSKLRSWYGKAPTASQTIWTFAWYARNHWNLWGITEWMQELYLELCFLAAYKTTNAQSAIGMGYVSSSWSSDPWPNAWVNTYNKWMTYWTTSWTEPMKFLWIEHWYGWIWEWVNGRSQTSSGVMISIPDATGTNRTSSYSYTPTGYRNVWSISPTSWSYIKNVLGNTYGWFTPTVTGGSETTYFTDCARWSSGSRVAIFGGVWDDGAKCGAFYWILGNDTSSSYASVGGRLMYLPNS